MQVRDSARAPRGRAGRRSVCPPERSVTVQILKMAERPGKKQLKALKRAREQAARAYREQRAAPQTPSLVDSSEPAVMDHFLQAYGELTDATVELYRRLEPQDPRHQQVREALAHAREVAGSVLEEGGAEPETEVDGELDGDPAAYYYAASGSVELVRIARPEPPPLDLNPAHNLPAVVRRAPKGWLPDESFLARRARVRRATHRWPDEAYLTRYLRERPLPDESSLRRYLRRRRELYKLHG
jgi:hypothetical protein